MSWFIYMTVAIIQCTDVKKLFSIVTTRLLFHGITSHLVKTDPFLVWSSKDVIYNWFYLVDFLPTVVINTEK